MKHTKTKPLTIVSPLHRASRQISIYLGLCMESFPATPNEGHMLAYLSLYGPSPVNELVRVFGYKNTTMTGILDRLERSGCIKRTINPNDRRSFIVKTTPKGSRTGKKARLFAERFDKAVRARVSKTDMQGYENVLIAIASETKVEIRKP